MTRSSPPSAIVAKRRQGRMPNVALFLEMHKDVQSSGYLALFAFVVARICIPYAARSRCDLRDCETPKLSRYALVLYLG